MSKAVSNVISTRSMLATATYDRVHSADVGAPSLLSPGLVFDHSRGPIHKLVRRIYDSYAVSDFKHTDTATTVTKSRLRFIDDLHDRRCGCLGDRQLQRRR